MNRDGRSLLSNLLKKYLKVGFGGLFAFLAFFICLEIALRLVNANQLPALPVFFRDGIPSLPGNSVFNVRFSGEPSVKYTFNEFGARISDRLPPIPKVTFLSIGDSQTLGYGIPFEDTYSVLSAKASRVDPSEVAILAAPQADPVTEMRAVASIPNHFRDHVKTLLFTINFGNDLDELYFSGGLDSSYTTPSWHLFFSRNSFVYMSSILILNRDSQQTLPPGANPVLLSTTSFERVVLANSLIESFDQMKSLLPNATRFVLILIPPDYVVSPSEFGKYEAFYSNHRDFLEWRDRLPESSLSIEALMNYVEIEASKHGFQTINCVEPLRRGYSQAIFSRSSHHLTVKGNKIVFEATRKSLPAF